MEDPARAAADAAARTAYGRLIAYLTTRTRNIAAAEDALSAAFAAALETWPRQGVPASPEAWLLTVARRAYGKTQRHAGTRARAEPAILLLIDEAAAAAAERADMIFPDERLRLLFACTHPGLDPAARTPLMLQVVMGLPAERIASAFLTSPAAMGQRLVRAKARLRESGAGFQVPDAQDLLPRLDAVLQAIFAAFGTAWDGGAGEEAGRGDLAAEAIFLAEMLVALLPGEPEPLGLLALLFYSHARRQARRDAAGAYVALSDQDPRLWDAAMLFRADAALRAAGAMGRFGRFQCEAAIQAVHAARRLTGQTDLAALEMLYDALARLNPTAGVLVSRAAVIGNRHGPAAGLAALDALVTEGLATYQPYWAVRAHLLGMAGQADAARAAYVTAGGLTEDPAIRAHLRARSAQLARDA